MAATFAGALCLGISLQKGRHGEGAALQKMNENEKMAFNFLKIMAWDHP